MDFKSCLMTLSLFAAGACSQAATAQNGGTASLTPVAPSPLETGAFPIRVERVRVFVKDGRPQAYVEAPLGDSCNSLQPIEQRRDASTIHVRMTGNRTAGPCAYLMQFIQQWIALDGAFTTGAYHLRVNDVRVDFAIVVGASGQMQIEPDPGPLPADPPASVIPGVVSPNDPPSDRRQPHVVPGSPGAPIGRPSAR